MAGNIITEEIECREIAIAHIDRDILGCLYADTSADLQAQCVLISVAL